MKKAVFTFLFLILVVSSVRADCWSIRDYDSQRMCLAKTKNDTGYCWQIRDNDQQKYCLATIKKDRSYCWQIRSNDLKQMCLSEL